MASYSPSPAHATLLAESHPLSPELSPTNNRRTRARPDIAETQATSNYFTLKAQSERHGDASKTHFKSATHANWDGNTSAFGTRPGLSAGRPSVESLWDRTPTAGPILVVSPDDTAESGPQTLNSGLTNLLQNKQHPGQDSVTTSEVLATKWHTQSDEEIQSRLSILGSASSPEASVDPYLATIRVLSAAVEKLTRARAELEDDRRRLQEKEEARRARADRLLGELQRSDQEVARRVVNLLFPAAHAQPKMIKRQSIMVRLTW